MTYEEMPGLSGNRIQVLLVWKLANHYSNRQFAFNFVNISIKEKLSGNKCS